VDPLIVQLTAFGQVFIVDLRLNRLFVDNIRIIVFNVPGIRHS